jgi:DNA processing protein
MTDAPHIRYYLGFNFVRGIGPTRLAQLIEQCGSVEAAWNANVDDLRAIGLDAKTSQALLAERRSRDLDAELDRLARSGISVVTLEDATYPRLLREAPNAPPLLYVRGTLDPADAWAVAVVGTRSPTSYGKEATRAIVGDLARSGITIVSGLAFGIDAIAHEAALDADGRTIAVLGCGPDIIYPERNRGIAQRIINQGAIITDYPPGTRPHAANFPPRNRIISGLSLGTLVIEAGEKSGALITVDFAADQGRDVFAVPGSVFSQKSKGTHRLIRDGAGLVATADDLLEALNLHAARDHQEAVADLPLDDPTEEALMRMLTAEPQHVDTLARACDLLAAQASAALTMLALKGYARESSPGQWVRAAGR